MPYTLLACGDALNEIDSLNFPAPIHVPARIVLGQKIATILSAIYPGDVNRVQQRIWGDMCATFYPNLPRTRLAATNRLDEINMLLNQHPIESNVVAAAFNNIWERARNEIAMPPYNWADVSDVIPDAQRADVVAFQKGMAYRRSLHAVNWETLIDLGPHAEALGQLLIVNDQAVPLATLPAYVFQPQADYNAGWTALPIDQKLAVCEAIYFHQQTMWDSQIMASVAGTLFSVCKSGGCTDAWLTSRLGHITSKYPALEIVNKVTLPAMTMFTQNYLSNVGDVNGLISFLKSIYVNLAESNINCLAWIIEQARGNNCTHLTSFSSAVVAFNGRPLSLLNVVPDGDRMEFVKAAANAILDPFGSLVTPAVPASRYPDYSNFGVEAKRRLDAVFRGYVGTEVRGGHYRPAQIREIER